MQQYLYCLLSFILLLFSQKNNAQNPNFLFNHITIQQGLSESTVRNIIEDKNGFMWFCSEDGLNKYNGYEFTVYRKNIGDIYSLSDNESRQNFIDSKGNLWIATRKGINIYDPLKERFYNYNNDYYPALKGLKKDYESIEEDKQGTIWIAEKYGLYAIHSLDEKPVYYSSEKFNKGGLLRTLKATPNGLIWIGTRDGLIQFNPKTQIFKDYRPLYGQGYQINDLHLDKENNLWMSTSKGLKIINGATGKLKEYRPDSNNPHSINGDNVIKVVPYQDGNYIVGMDGFGLDYFDIKNDKFFHYTHENGSELNCNNITEVFIDSKNDLWLGTFLNGINYSNSSTNLFHFIKNNIYSDKEIKKGIVTSFLKDNKDNLWIATDGGGIFVKKNGADSFVNYTKDSKPLSLSSNVILCLTQEKDDIWISTYNGGLNLFDSKKNKFVHFLHNQKDTNSIATNKLGAVIAYQGKVWVGVDGFGLDVLDPATQHFKHFKIDPNDPSAIHNEWIINFFIDSSGNLWLCTLGGLTRYISEKDGFKNYSFEGKDGIAARNAITEIYEDTYHKIWLGTNGGGLIRFDPVTETSQIFTTKEGISSDNIKIILQDNFNNLWIATTNGITKLNLKNFSTTMYTIKDGIPPNAFYFKSKFKDKKGNLYFGASGGYLIIDPKAAQKNKRIPPVVLTKLKINNIIQKPDTAGLLKVNINNSGKLNLASDQNAISVEFASLNFNNPDKNKYSYLLKGFDEHWSIPGTQKYATYTNLNPGTYTFMVKGTNNDGVWNKEPARLTFEIATPFWRTWWFEALEAMLVVLIFYLIYLWRISVIKSKNKELEEIIENRTLELQESNNQLEAFVYKASHDIRGPLKSVIGMTTVGINDLQGNDVALNYFDHILRSTKKLDKLLSELLELTKVKQTKIIKEELNIEEIIRDVISSFQHLENFKKITFDIKINQKVPFFSDKNLLQSIVQNLIENPIKYLDNSKSSSFLKIRVDVSEKETRFIFQDNGPGIPEEAREKIFDMFYKVNSSSDGTGLGLYIVKTSVEKLKGKITLSSETGKGSVFTVTFKMLE